MRIRPLFTGIFLATALSAASLIPHAYAADADANADMVDRVVAVVNNRIISYQDLMDRMTFTARNIKAKLSRDQQRELLHSQLDELIEEELVRQYATDQEITVSPAEIMQSISEIETRNKQPVGSFLKFAGTQKETALAKIRTNLREQKIITRDILPRINISKSEVDSLIQNMLARQQANEYELAQIFIPVTDGEKGDKDAEAAIHKVYQQLTAGADFGDLAKLYSRDSAAQDAGYLGWFNSGETLPGLEGTLESTPKGGVTEPFRSQRGWHIFKVLNIRSGKMPDVTPITQLKLIQIYAPIDSTAGTPAALQNKNRSAKLAEIKKKASSARGFETKAEELKKSSAIYRASGDMGWIPLPSLEPALQKALQDAKTDSVIGPITTDKGVYLFYVDGRRQRDSETLQKIRERIVARLTQQRSDLAMRRLLLDLRRKAYIDIKL